MIAKMKKVFLVVLDRHRREALQRLRSIGLVHVERGGGGTPAAPSHGDGEDLAVLLEQRGTLERALQQLPVLGGEGGKAVKSLPPATAEDLRRALEVAAEAAGLHETVREAREAVERLAREGERLASWSDFDPADVALLESRGVHLRFYELSPKQLGGLPEELRSRAFVVMRAKGVVRLAAVGLGEAPALAFDPLPVPDRGPAEVAEALAGQQEALARALARLEALGGERARVGAALELLLRHVEFEEVRSGMVEERELCYLTGYVPSRRTAPLQQAAADEGWALLIDDPGPADPVPTLIENPRWVQIIQPVFNLLGTVPGYREFDISFWFLLFFSLFFAMLIGDAGYGLVFFVLTLAARIKMRKSPPGPFFLMFVLSVSTVIWGVLSGTWFGVEGLARNPVLSRLVIPDIASFGQDNAESVMLLCFVIGAVHLSIAHLVSFIRNLPRINAFTDLGWLSILWGMFFLIRYIVLGLELNPLAVWLVGGGLVVVMICGEQQGRFFKGLLIGIAKLPLKLLNSVSAFSDIISYVRLFAVGLASIEVAKSFNAMAADIGFGIPTGLISAFILFFGHTLNIVMGALSVIVHGVRLNMLEFSGHLGMEWTGNAYAPFRDTTTPESGNARTKAERREV